MTAQTVVLLLLLVLMKDSSCLINPFQIEATTLETVEGSCAELKCSVTSTNDFQTVTSTDASQSIKPYWFWIKDGIYNNKESKFTGTVIYSTNTEKRPVSTDYQGRVNYTGSLLTSLSNGQANPTCSVVICNLTKSDSGVYAARVIGKEKWMSAKNITLNVTENLCPITFEKPPVANDSSTIPLKCSTLMSCPSDLEMRQSTQLLETKSQPNEGKMKSINISLTVNWQDNGKEVSCQTKDNKDPYLIQKTSLTVQYAPREVSAVLSPEGTVKENQTVTLKCNAQGNPNPTFTWFVNDTEISVGGVGEELKFDSIKASQSGGYTCKASNILGSSKSSSVSVDVNYPPEVKVTTSSAYEVTEREKVILTCTVTRSKPEPRSYTWYKDKKQIKEGQTFVVARVTPEDGGSYICKATNNVGTGTSAEHKIQVRYSPRKAQISIGPNKIQVKVGEPLTLTCSAKAFPLPSRFSWYSYHTERNRDHSQRMPSPLNQKSLYFRRVERSDDACYVCNATNDMGTGENSEPMCIQVLYPPTTPLLFMVNLVNESQPTTIRCTVESYPPSTLTLTRTFGSNSAKEVFIHSKIRWNPNTLKYTFNATSADKGSYTCVAENNMGSKKSYPKELVVNYRPQGVTVKYQPSVVNENTKLELSCSALSSYPPVKSFTWTKMKGGKTESIGNSPTLTIKSVIPFDSGQYGCTARNEMGIGESEKVEIKVRYAPKVTKITRGAEQQLSNGKSSVALSCISESYPEVKTIIWFRKEQDEDVRVSNQKTHTVLSDQPGDYYCIARNDIGGKSSESIQMFVDRSFVKILIIFFLLMFLVVLMFLVIYRRRKSRSTQRGNTNTPSSFGSQDWWNSIGRRNQPTMAEAFRSRDDLLTDQQPHPRGQRRQQPRPDNTSATNSNAVYYTVNLPASQQGPSGEMPVKQKAQHTKDESLNYASLHFKNKEKKKKERAEVDTVYAVVSKNKTPKKTEGENQQDYENLKTAHAAKSPNPPDSDSDSDTSEDEVELNYSKVSFKLKPGHQRTKSDSSSTSSTSSTSSEEETQYSQVKI